MARTHPYTIIPGKLLTADEYAHLPEEPGWRTELHQGKVVKMPLVLDTAHGWIASNIVAALVPYVRQHDLGRVSLQQEGYDISAGSEAEGAETAAPDVALVRTEQLPLVQAARAQGKYPKVGPAFVVEVISPSESMRWARERAVMWRDAGTRLVWIVWPEEQAVDVWLPDQTITRHVQGQSLSGGEAVPGWSMTVTEVFA